jgi:branched-chain amino acid transport system substrate-binding protein
VKDLRTVALAAALTGALLAAVLPAAADQPPVKIGVVYSYTGATANAGIALDASMNAWLTLHHGMVGGRKVEIIRRDDTGTAPDVARRLAQELVVQDHVDFLVGSLYTPNAIAVMQVSTAAKVPFFIVNAATTGIIEGAPYTARFGATMLQNTNPLAFWSTKMGYKRAFVIVSDYAPGIDSLNIFEKSFGAGGGTIVGDLRVPVHATDFTAYVQRIKDAKPDMLYAFIVNGDPSVAFFKAVKQAGLEASGVKLVVNSATVDELDLPSLGADAVGAISASQYAPTTHSALNDAYLRAFRAQAPRGLNEPDFMAESGYDIMSAIDTIVAKQTGPLDPDVAMRIVRGLRLESPRGPVEIDAQTREVDQNMYVRRLEKHGDDIESYTIETMPMVGGEVRK